MDDLCSKTEANEQVKKLEDQITCLKEELDQRIGELQALKPNSQPTGTDQVKVEKEQKADDLTEGKTEILFDCPIENIFELFRTNGQKCSEMFTCGGIDWNLAAQVLVKIDLLGQSTKHLSCILAYLGDPQKYECQTYFELRLLSQSSNRVHKVMTTHYTFTDLNGFGFPTFIAEFELFNPNSGFLKQGKIKLQIYLRIEKLNPINNG